ncbi:secreted protein, partial [Rhodopirellula maiorica SM1]
MRICHILPLSLAMAVFLSVSARPSTAQEPEDMMFSEQVSLFDSL